LREFTSLRKGGAAAQRRCTNLECVDTLAFTEALPKQKAQTPRSTDAPREKVSPCELDTTVEEVASLAHQ